MIANVHHIDRELDKCRLKIEDKIASESCASSALSRPDAVTDFEVCPQGEYIVARWTDNRNRFLRRYNIIVAKQNETGDLTIPCDAQDNCKVYKQNLGQHFEGWCTYFVRVCAINEEGVAGPATNPKGLYMNQHPPHMKPGGLRTLHGSNTSVKIRVNRPDKYDDFA